MTKTFSKSVIVLCVLSIFVAGSFSLSGCAALDYQFGRVSMLSYRVYVSSKVGERLEEITLYLPFPGRKGELQRQVLESARKQILRVYSEESDPKISISAVDTEYGKMLKIHATNLDKEEVGFSFEGKHSYTNLLPRGDASKVYPLKPMVFEDGREKSYVFVSRKAGTGFYLHVVYDALYSDSYLPTHTGYSGKRWIIGKKYEADITISPLENRIEAGEQGWVEVPVWSKP